MSMLTRVFAWLLALALVALPLAAVLAGWVAPERWPIRRLEVTAEYRNVSDEQVRDVVAAHVGRGYFDTDAGVIGTALAGLPWVDQVEVRKRWPDRIEVRLFEHQAVAHWGQDRMLSDQGVLFQVPLPQDPQGLPRLVGPDERASEVLAFFEQARAQLRDVGLVPVGARLSRRGGWALQLDNGARIVIGRDGDPKARLARLARVLPQLMAGTPRSFERIDLRYTNGLAIAWAAPVAPARAGGPAG